VRLHFLAASRLILRSTSYFTLPNACPELPTRKVFTHTGFTTIHNFGCSDREETKTFYYCPEGSGNASSANLWEGASVRTITCQVKRLDGA
jgi:hypothetical protein